MSPQNDRREALFFRLGSRPIPRVTRIMDVVAEFNVHCLFIGARRESDLPLSDRWDGFDVIRIGRPFPLVNGRRPLTYLLGVLSYWRAAFALILSRRPQLVHASDFEAGVPTILAARILNIPVVYNIHDNLSVRYSVPRFIAAALNVAEGLLVRAASVTLVPEAFRRDLLPSWARGTVHVVRNSPHDPGYTPPDRAPNGTPRVLFAGWLDVGRGLRQMVAMARAGQIRLTVAGEGDALLRDELSRTPNVDFIGFCDHREIMARTAQCDYVAAFYDPVRVINRYAASNKIAEALAVGRPVLTNTELLVAPDLIRSGVALAVPYAKLGELGDQIRAHRSEQASYVACCERSRKLYEELYHSGEVLRATIDALNTAGCGQWPSTTAKPLLAKS